MPVGQRAPSINMSKILRQLGFRTGQSRKVTYYRAPIYGRDAYGVENTTVAVNEIVVPNIQSYIRTQVTKDFVIQRGGGNIIGSALVYLPRLDTLKNFPNMDQANNVYFNDVEGWDRMIDVDREIFTVPTSGTDGWSSTAGDFTSDGESLLYTLTGAQTLTYSSSATSGQYGRQNILETDRIRFQLYANASDLYLTQMKNTVISGSTEYTLTYSGSSPLPLTSGGYITVDVPYASGGYINTSGSLSPDTDTTSIYTSGTRYPYIVTSGNNFDYVYDLSKFGFTLSGTGQVKIRLCNFYRGINWSVHSIRDYNDEYICLECVRTSGKRQSLRRAYGE